MGMLDLGKGHASGKFSIPSKKCLVLISIYTVPEWVGWKHFDIAVALDRCRLT